MYYDLSKAELGIQECLRALNLAQTASLHIKDGAYADALRLIEELERSQMRLVDNYSFSKRLKSWLPGQIEQIRSKAVADLRGWLASLRSKSETIGRQAVDQAQRRIDSNSADTDVLQDAIRLQQEASIEWDGLLAALHLFDLMGKRKEFLGLLCEGRRQQLEIILEGQMNSINSVQTLLENLTGFFIAEFGLTQLPQRIYSMPFVEALWELALGRISKVITDFPKETVDDLLKLKWTLVFFLNALQIYPLPSTQLRESLDALFFRFVDLLTMAKIQSIEDCQVDMKVVQESIKEFVEQFRAFLVGIPRHSSELDDIARKAVDDRILKSVNQMIMDKCQTTTDIKEIFKSFDNFASLKESIREICTLLTPPGAKTVKMQAEKMFTVSQDQLKILIKSNLQVKLSELLVDGFKQIDRLPGEKPKGISKPIQDVTSFFKEAVPVELHGSIVSEVLAKTLIQCLCDPSIQSMNLEFIESFASDLAYLLQSFPSLDGDASESMEELEEMLLLASAPSCHDFMDPLVRKEQYSHLKPQVVLPFLSKITPSASTKRVSIEDLIMLLGKQSI